jgi:hypothetical protein
VVVLTKAPAVPSPRTLTLLQRMKSTGSQLTGATSRITYYLAVLGVGKSRSAVDSLDPPSPPMPARAPEARWVMNRWRRRVIVLVSPVVAVAGERRVERDEAAQWSQLSSTVGAVEAETEMAVSLACTSPVHSIYAFGPHNFFFLTIFSLVGGAS